MRRRCPTGKVRFRDRIAAEMALLRVAARLHDRREKTEKRAYRCRQCEGWHLTSMERGGE